MNSLTHSVWTCKYHVVWIPKYRRKKPYGDIAKYLEETFHELARQQERRIVTGHICADHIHILIEIPPNPSLSDLLCNWQSIIIRTEPVLCQTQWLSWLSARPQCLIGIVHFSDA
ncbi:MAG: IS200/IS605 family transposase, partial [Treponema sp.]|nr:IS200/IS605 family transposase [Treponema sp.]